MPFIVRLSTIFVLPLVVLIAVAVFAGAYLDTDAPLIVPVACSGLFAFVLLLGLGQEEKGALKLDEGPLRAAIAAAIVVEYIVLVAIVAFFSKGPQQLPPLTQTLITNFTTIVGVVIASYFGASAYIQGQKKKDGNSPGSTPPKADETARKEATGNRAE